MTGHLFSFVAASRNDDHGGDVLRRTQSFVRSLSLQATRHKVRCELILVEWNPPRSRAPLGDMLEWPEGNEWFTAKVVTVPHEIHLRLPNARSLAFFQMIAKNAGIRRASGDYVVATNIDIVFSDEVFEWLKSSSFNDSEFYRSDRWDIPNDVQFETDFNQFLRRAKSEPIRKNLKEGTYDLVHGSWLTPDLKRVDHCLVHPVQTGLMDLQYMLDQDQSIGGHLRHLLDITLPDMRRFYLTPNVHENGCGDFTMLSATAWNRVRGYPEWPVFSWNIDSIILKQLSYNGYTEVIAPPAAVHYHIEHGYGSGYTPQGADALFRRMNQRSVTVISWEDYRKLILEMDDTARQGMPITFNSADWGMVNEGLPTTTCVTPASPPRPARARNGTKLVENFDATGLKVLRHQATDLEFSDQCSVDVGWANGGPLVRVSAGPAPWSYLAIWGLSDVAPKRQPFWLRFTCTVLQGAIGIMMLCKRNNAFFIELNDLHVGDGAREIVLHVPARSDPGDLVIRTRNGGATVFELSDIELLWEPVVSKAEVRVCG